MENEVKEPALKYNYISPEEYLIAERAATEKSELHQGKIVAMAGASLKHNTILTNLIGSIGPYLSGKECSIYPSDLRVQIPGEETFTYPDATIVCGEPEMRDEAFDTLKNPSVIIEILSPSTEKYDRGTKFFFYIQIPSLKEYIIVSSTGYYIQVARKQDDHSWKFEEITELHSALQINTIQFNLELSSIYARVKF